jgi:Rps23 Pro-64 3,4-dihydroxylase Tpa1-like proline 4-hydroxylase
MVDSFFINGKPFPNIVIDNLFDTEFLLKVLQDTKDENMTKWWKYNNYFEKKLAYNNYQNMGENLRKYFNLVNSFEFCKKLENMTGIKNILADPSLYGGGIHKIKRGGKLDIHADFNFHRITGWNRKLNLITYLNKDWNIKWGGETEFWNLDMSKCIKKIPPLFNTTVIFLTNNETWHGHPQPLECPHSVSRLSLATYYYTVNNSKKFDNYQSTNYVVKRGVKETREIKEMRIKRRKGRLRDETE